MNDTDNRLTNMETQLREISSKFEKFLTSEKHETLQAWRVASLKKLERTAHQIDFLIEFIETELITRREELIADGNVVHLTNFFEDQSNSDLEIVINRLKKIRKGIFDA